jgi:autotransporter-associated beta strand protein
MRASSGAASFGVALLAGASLTFATAAQAQSVWGGPASTTTTQAYKLGTNWDPNGAPVAAGQSAIFDTTGKSTINVGAGAIVPDSWTFNANSQSYTIGGAGAVNFSATGGLFSNANAGQTISIANNLGESAAGAQLQQLGNSTLVLTGNNTYSGGTVIAAGTLQLGNGGTTGKINGDVLNLGALAFNRSNNITFGGLIFGGGQVNQIGTGTLILTGANSYSGGTLISNGGTLRVNNSTPGVSSSVGTGTVTLDNGQFQAGAANLTFSNNFAVNNTPFGSAIDTNGRKLTISGNITDGNGPGALTVVDSTMSGGVLVLTGANTYSGGTTICNCGTLQLGTTGASGSIVGTVSNEGSFDIVNANTAGITTVTNKSGAFMTFRNSTDAGTMTIRNRSGGSLEFRQGSSAADATINNRISASTVFTNASAGNATINNIGGPGVGIVEFDKNSSAGSATINNAGHSVILFNDQATLAGAKIVNRNAGQVFFYSQSSAGNAAASITNNGHGQVHFLNQSTAGSATITNNNFGVLDFSNRSSADNATIVNSSAIGMAFLNRSTAGNAFITTNNNSATFFFDRSDGGTARFETEAGSIVDFSGSRGANNDGRINAGSIAGAGNYYIGAGNTLSVGGNDRSTEVSGVIADTCGCGPGGPGALEKVGLGTMILSGTNTYTGGTTITAGTLQLGNGGATGSILGDVVNNSIFAINRSDAYAFNGAISGSGEFQQIGAGTTTLTNTNTYTGPTTVSAGTLIISATGSITSDVTNNATFSNAGTVTGSLTNTSTASNSGTITNGLTNAAGTTTNTGTINGGATVAGGTLNTNTATSVVNGGLVNAGTVNAAGVVNGAIANNAGTFTVTGVLTSDSTFTNAAAATLAVGGAGAYTLQGMLSNSGAVTVANGGQLIASSGGITNNVGGSITVAAGGTVKDDLNNASLVTNGGAYIANVASNTGLINNQAGATWTGNANNNAGGMLNNSGTWTGAVANAGTFVNDAGATVSGLLTNTAGITTNNGSLNGGAFVSGGFLTGTGSVGNTMIAGGGAFAPGNGTPGSFMTVAGNLAFQSGALYLVGLNPATSTFAKVTGAATLNGGAGAAFLAGNYVARQYTILTAAGGVSGTFGSFDTLGVPTGFQTSLSYDAHNVFLNLDLVLAKYAGLNANQQNAANALVNFFNTTGGVPAVFGTLTPGGLTQASGELATGSQQTTFDAMNLFLGLLTDPFVAGRGESVTAGTGAPQFAEESEAANAYAANGKPRSKSERDAYAAIYRKAPLRDVYDPRWSVWAAGYGGSQTTDGNIAPGSNNTRSSIGGAAVGADYRFSPNLLAGFAIAGGGTNFSVNGSGTGRSDLFQAGAFARYTAGPAYVSAALAYGWQNVTTDRTVTIAGTDLLHANFNANTWSGRVEGGYRFVAPWMGGVGITPYAAGQSTTFDLPAYAEQALAGANTFALAYGAKSVTDTRSELGIRTDKSFAMPNGIFTLRGRAAWAHDFNPDRNIGATFQTLPGASFVVNGAMQASDSALVTASAEMKWLNGFALAATFEGAFSGVTSSYAGKGVARYTW